MFRFPRVFTLIGSFVLMHNVSAENGCQSRVDWKTEAKKREIYLSVCNIYLLFHLTVTVCARNTLGFIIYNLDSAHKSENFPGRKVSFVCTSTSLLSDQPRESE